MFVKIKIMGIEVMGMLQTPKCMPFFILEPNSRFDSDLREERIIKHQSHIPHLIIFQNAITFLKKSQTFGIYIPTMFEKLWIFLCQMWIFLNYKKLKLL